MIKHYSIIYFWLDIENLAPQCVLANHTYSNQEDIGLIARPNKIPQLPINQSIDNMMNNADTVIKV